ncbi:MAG: hypothetical protein MI702_12165, partial [Chlorobiales bacterium]|nr:hypothetical protein [Chlorobiales bacterium]
LFNNNNKKNNLNSFQKRSLHLLYMHYWPLSFSPIVFEFVLAGTSKPQRTAALKTSSKKKASAGQKQSFPTGANPSITDISRRRPEPCSTSSNSYNEPLF